MVETNENENNALEQQQIELAQRINEWAKRYQATQNEKTRQAIVPRMLHFV